MPRLAPAPRAPLARPLALLGLLALAACGERGDPGRLSTHEAPSFAAGAFQFAPAAAEPGLGRGACRVPCPLG